MAIFYCQIQRRTLKTERPSAWDTRRRPRKSEPENAARRGQEIHAGRTAHPASCVQNEHMRLFSLICIHVDKLSTYHSAITHRTCGHRMLNLRKSLKKRVERGTYTCPCCGEQFLPIRADARYCSNACRQKDYRKRKVTAHASL